MEKSENILNEIIEMAPTLSKIKKENAFYASDQYFDALTANIEQKIPTFKKQSKTIHLLGFFQKPQFAAAASFIIILTVAAVYFYQHKTTQALAQSNTIYWDEILNENNTVIDRIDETLLVEMITNEATTNNIHKKNTVNQPIQKTIDEVSDEIESSYSNDIFNEL